MAARTPIGLIGKSGTTPVPMSTPSDTRVSLAALLRRVSGIRARSGRFRGPTGANMLVTGTAGWAYSVEPGAFAVAPDGTSGAYIVANDAVVTVATDSKPASGSRIDIIYGGVNDAWDRSAGSSAAVIGCVRGASSTGTPTAPTVPDGCVEIARNVMTSAATTTASSGNTITQSTDWTAAAGGTVYYPTVAAMTADTARPEGEMGYAGDYQHMYARIGGGVDAQMAFASDVPAPVPDKATRDALYPSPTQGARVFRLDLNRAERYWAAYNATTNPRGALVAGWYPDGIVRASSYSGGVQQGSTGSAPLIRTGNAFETMNGPELIQGMSLSTGQLTVPWGGYYRVVAELTWQSNGAGSGQRNVFIDTGTSMRVLGGGATAVDPPNGFTPHTLRIERVVRAASVDANAWIRPGLAHNDPQTLSVDVLAYFEYLGPASADGAASPAA